MEDTKILCIFVGILLVSFGWIPFANWSNKTKTKWNKKEIKIHPNGFIARDHNKRITFFQKEEKDGFIIDFKSIIKKKSYTYLLFWNNKR